MINNSQITNVNNTLSTKQPIACQMSSSNDPNSPSTLQNIKCEAFATSPKEEINTKNHDIGEEKNLNLRECDISPTTNLPTHAQKNNKYMKSTRTEVSPKSGENTNSKSLIAKNEKLTPDTEEANNENKLSTKRSAAGQIKDEELDKPLTEKASGSNTIAKENDDVLNSLGNIKKEEENSPQLSPGPFDTLESGNPTSVDNAIHGKFNENKNAIVNNQKERLLGAPLNSEESLAFNAANNNQINEHNPHYLISSSNNNSNFMQEFMQQQNHIFVFSTQLANKGAESVINGHFPTIIAYHCMQPATKNFLEDFFIKNPMKVTKLQRQNSMNFCNANMQVNNSVQWLNMCNSKIAQSKHSANKNLSNISSSIDNIKGGVPPSVRGGINNTYSEAHDALGNENEFMCWDQIRQSVEGESLKVLDGASILRHQHSTNKSLNFMESNDNNVPSLQGVKVPDENLTPQQRQHREEQLAKLKKMNQFLFPENGSDFKVEGGVGGTGGGGSGGGGVGSQSNMGGSKVSTENVPNILLCNQMNAAQLNAAVQNSSNNVPGVNPQLNCNNENIATINEEHTLPSEITAAQDSGRLQNNINKSTPRNNNNSNMSGPNGGNIASNTDLINELNNSNIPTCPSNKNIQLPSAQKMEDNHAPTTPQLDWSKPQNQFYDERKNKLSGDHSNSLNPSTINHNLRCGNQNNAININTSSRNIQGPPPPYHSTQRSASVPIVQSPNPSSPTNPTSNLSLPSPHTSVGQGNPENSPSLEVHPNMQSNVISNITACGQTKTNFHQEGSPSNINRNRSGFSQLNSNPSTPLSNMSPKEVESYSNLGSTEFKNLRGNRPQTPRSPPNTNQTSLDQYNTDNRFNSTSPGTSFCQPSNGVNTLNAFKTGSIERQSSIPSNNQFGRRSENLPLNPNSARAAPSKPNTSFDPISSLAQMSQQLTNCTPHNQHIGPNSSVMNVGGMSDMGLLSNSNPGLENAMNPADSVLDNCGGNNSSTMGMLPTHGPGASFINNNCHQIMGPMGQRMLNPKLCGNFLQNPNNLRDGHGNMHPMGPVPRVGGNRMQMNFNNYNVSPNIQVKASTPNTIQYMPVRPQNNNNSLRPPPSLEFLQRYANPQMAMGVNMMDAGQIMQGNSVTNNEQHKFVGGNPNGNPGMNMYQNCNQSNLMNLDQDELQHGATVNDINLGGPMRGSRSMRQHPMQSRMHNMNAVNQTYGSIPQDSLECGTESAHIYNNMGENIIGPSQNFPNTQQKAIKNIGQPICQSTSNNINSMTNPTGLTNEHAVNMHPTLGNAAGIGANSSGNNVPNVSSLNNNGNYKYIGPTPNDLKYAQQYHSFQQQLYATSTRNPHGSTTNGVAANSSTNPNFFVNK